MTKEGRNLRVSIGRRLTPLGESIDHPNGHAVKTLESKETRASKEIRVTHNSVFAAHRLQCRMTIRENRHPAFSFALLSFRAKSRNLWIVWIGLVALRQMPACIGSSKPPLIK